MQLPEARERLTELYNNTLMFEEELGGDAVTNFIVLSDAISRIGAVADIDAFMAEIEASVVVYDMTADEEDYDNSGVVVILDDGSTVSYDEYAAGEGITEEELPAPVYGGEDAFETFASHREPTRSLAEILSHDII